MEDRIDLREINKITVQRDHEDGVGDLCSVRGRFDLPHQGQPLSEIKVLRGKTTRGGEDEAGEGGEEQGGREVKVTVISFTVSVNDALHPGWWRLRKCYKRAGGFINPLNIQLFFVFFLVSSQKDLRFETSFCTAM